MRTSQDDFEEKILLKDARKSSLKCLVIGAILGALGMLTLHASDCEAQETTIVRQSDGTPIELTDDWQNYIESRQGEEGKDYDLGSQDSWQKEGRLEYVESGCREYCGNE